MWKRKAASHISQCLAWKGHGQNANSQWLRIRVDVAGKPGVTGALKNCLRQPIKVVPG
jgi:hypothetical protein